MHRHSGAPGDETEDLVTRHRSATAREPHLDVGVAGHDDALVPLDRGAFPAPVGLDAPCTSDRRVVVGTATRARRLLAPAGLSGGVAVPCGEPSFDRLLGAAGLHEGEPVAVRPGPGRPGGDDLDGVAVAELGVQKDRAPVDASADTAIPHLGVDGIGEVDRGRTPWQGDDIAPGGEDEDLLVQAKQSDEFDRVGRGRPPIEKAPLPRPAGCPRFVLTLLRPWPYGRTPLRAPVHVPGANLQFDRLRLGPRHRRVQRLVHVELRHRDVILELPWKGLPSRVDLAENGVAVTNAADDDPEAHQVVDVSEIDVSGRQIPVDRIIGLHPPGHLGSDSRLPQVGGNDRHDPSEEGVTARRPLRHRPRDRLEVLGFERGERQLLQLPLQRLQAQLIRQRREDVHRRAGHAPLFRTRHRADGPQLPGRQDQLEDQRFVAPGGGHHEFADDVHVMRLAQGDAVELADRLDEVGDLVPECGPDVANGTPPRPRDGCQHRGAHHDLVGEGLGDHRGQRGNAPDGGIVSQITPAEDAAHELVGPMEPFPGGGVVLE